MKKKYYKNKKLNNIIRNAKLMKEQNKNFRIGVSDCFKLNDIWLDKSDIDNEKIIVVLNEGNNFVEINLNEDTKKFKFPILDFLHSVTWSVSSDHGYSVKSESKETLTLKKHLINNYNIKDLNVYYNDNLN